MTEAMWKVVIVVIIAAAFFLARRGNALGLALAFLGCGIALKVLS